jgi:DnaD/phage-associated family protein
MKPEIILMILTFAKAEKEKGSSISPNYIYKIAENWLEEGIETVALAEQKLRAVEGSNKLWREISEKCSLKKTLTPKQAARVCEWQADFSNSVILMAADSMMENADKPNFSYLDTILINWKKQGIKTEGDVERDKEQFRRQKKERENKAAQGKISRKPTYDLDKIKKDILNNTEI